jgi:hypothetical protein
MAALLFPTIVDSETVELVIMPKDSVIRSEEERRLLGAHWVERKNIWEDCREVDGADFTLTVYLSYDESRDGSRSLTPTFIYLRLSGKYSWRLRGVHAMNRTK